MPVYVEELIKAFESWAPLRLAESWDNVGLQVGSPRKEVEHIALALDLTPVVCRKIIDLKADCLITHHPFIFKPIKRLNWDHWQHNILRELIQHDVALLSLHTNLDSARNGVTEALAEALDLKLERALQASPGAKCFKLVTYLPKGEEEKLRELLLESEAGVIGPYRGCSFVTEGQGSFFPEDQARPHVGERGRLNLVPEVRMEFLIPAFEVPSFLARLRELHPYETVPVDLYPVEGEDLRFGLGRIGELPLACTVEDLAQRLSSLLKTPSVFVVGEPHKTVKRVALCAGAGGDLLQKAYSLGAEVYITAEVKYHQAREAEALGLPLVVLGHFESERIIVPKMAEFLKRWQEQHPCELRITILEEESPFRLVGKPE